MIAQETNPTWRISRHDRILVDGMMSVGMWIGAMLTDWMLTGLDGSYADSTHHGRSRRSRDSTPSNSETGYDWKSCTGTSRATSVNHEGTPRVQTAMAHYKSTLWVVTNAQYMHSACTHPIPPYSIPNHLIQFPSIPLPSSPHLIPSPSLATTHCALFQKR